MKGVFSKALSLMQSVAMFARARRNCGGTKCTMHHGQHTWRPTAFVGVSKCQSLRRSVTTFIRRSNTCGGTRIVAWRMSV